MNKIPPRLVVNFLKLGLVYFFEPELLRVDYQVLEPVSIAW